MPLKISYYIDDNVCPISTFYTKILLKNEFEKLGYIFDICSIIDKNIKYKENSPYINSINNSMVYKYDIKWKKPSIIDYDILILTNIYNMSYEKDNRIDLANYFVINGKKVIAVKDDLTMEYLYITNSVIYTNYISYPLGISSYKRKNINKDDFLSIYKYNNVINNKPIFKIVPLFSNIGFDKSSEMNSMSISNFYTKYKIPLKNKIILVFLPSYKKYISILNDKEKFNKYLVFKWFIDNFLEIYDFFNNNDFTIIIKVHRGDVSCFIPYNVDDMNNIKIIDPYDTHEAIKYSYIAITGLSNICYELYLQKLPVIELGNGIYFPNWSQSNINKMKINNINYKDLIFGKVIGDDPINFLVNPFEKLLDAIKKDYNIKNFPYRKNNPFYGSSYKTNINDCVNALIKLF